MSKTKKKGTQRHININDILDVRVHLVGGGAVKLVLVRQFKQGQTENPRISFSLEDHMAEAVARELVLAFKKRAKAAADDVKSITEAE